MKCNNNFINLLEAAIANTPLCDVVDDFFFKDWQRNEMHFDQVPSLWRKKPVQLNIATLGQLVTTHLIALATSQSYLKP